MTANSNSLPNFDKLWDFSNPAATEKKFKELIPQAESSGNLDYFFQLITQIARAQGLQKKFEDAHQTLSTIEMKLSTQTPIAEIRYFLEKGRVYNSSKKKELAQPLFLKAFELAQERAQDNLAVDAAHMVAIAETSPEAQMLWNLKALSVAETSKDPSAQDWLGSLYNNIGWTYHDSGRFEQALNMFTLGLDFREKKGELSSIRIAKWSVARAHRSLMNYNEALKIQIELEQEFEKVSEKDGYVFEELGELYLALSKTDLAKKYFALAYVELSKDTWFVENEPARLERARRIGEIK